MIADVRKFRLPRSNRGYLVSRPVDRRRELLEIERRTKVVQVLVFIAGAIFFALFVGTFSSSNSSAVDQRQREIFRFLGETLIAGSAVAFIVERASVRENVVRIENAIEATVEESLRPALTPVLADAVSDYRWTSILSCPPKGDPLPTYLVQDLVISRTVRVLPRELRMVCVASIGDEVEAYGNDSRYVFRWAVDKELDPCDLTVFDIQEVAVNGLTLEEYGESLRQTEIGSRCFDQAFLLPDSLIDAPSFRLTIKVRVRKHVGTDERVRLRTQVLSRTQGARFECFVDSAVGVRRFFATTGDVSSMGPRPEIRVVPAGGHEFLGAPSTSGLHAMVSAEGVLQPGSSVAFHLERHL